MSHHHPLVFNCHPRTHIPTPHALHTPAYLRDLTASPRQPHNNYLPSCANPHPHLHHSCTHLNPLLHRLPRSQPVVPTQPTWPRLYYRLYYSLYYGPHTPCLTLTHLNQPSTFPSQSRHSPLHHPATPKMPATHVHPPQPLLTPLELWLVLANTASPPSSLDATCPHPTFRLRATCHHQTMCLPTPSFLPNYPHEAGLHRLPVHPSATCLPQVRPSTTCLPSPLVQRAPHLPADHPRAVRPKSNFAPPTYRTSTWHPQMPTWQPKPALSPSSPLPGVAPLCCTARTSARQVSSPDQPAARTVPCATSHAPVGATTNGDQPADSGSGIGIGIGSGIGELQALVFQIARTRPSAQAASKLPVNFHPALRLPPSFATCHLPQLGGGQPASAQLPERYQCCRIGLYGYPRPTPWRFNQDTPLDCRLASLP